MEKEGDSLKIIQPLTQKEETNSTSPYCQMLFPRTAQCFSFKAQQKATDCEGMIYHTSYLSFGSILLFFKATVIWVTKDWQYYFSEVYCSHETITKYSKRQNKFDFEVDFLCLEHVMRENVLTVQAYSSLMTDLNWNLEIKEIL